MITLDDLIASETTDELVALATSILVQLGIPADKWRKESSIAALRAMTAQIFSTFSSLISDSAKSGFLDLAPFDPNRGGGWLGLWAKSMFDVDWVGPSFAVGEVTIDNTLGGGNYNILPFQCTFEDSATHKFYRNTETVVVAPGGIGTFAFQAVEQGSASTATPGAIDTVSSPTMTGVTVSNAEALIGSDGQTREQLIATCRAKRGSLSPNGAPDAYNFFGTVDPTTVQLLVKLGLTAKTSSPITRTVPVSDGNGGVKLVIATDAGAPVGGDVTIVDTRIKRVCRPYGIKASAAAANEVVVPVAYEAWLKGSSLDVAGAELAFANALAKAFVGFPLGGVVIPPATAGAIFTNALEGILFQATPGVVKVVVSGIDAPLAAIDVAVLGAITPTVHIL